MLPWQAPSAALALLLALSCAPRPDPQREALREELRRLERRVSALEAAQRRSDALWAPPAAAAEMPTEPPAPAAPQKEAPAAPAPAAAPAERAVLLGTTLLSGPYASVAGRGVALLSPEGQRPRPPRPRRARMEQKDRDFVPALLALPVGSTVAFPNSDPVYHNVFSLSPAKRFDLGVFQKGESRDVTFDEPGVVQVLCNLHASMSAYLVIHEEPHAALLDRSGRFGFRDLPPGRYRLRVWYERAGEVAQQKVTLAAGPNRVQVPIVADLAPTLPPNKEGKPRGPRPPR